MANSTYFTFIGDGAATTFSIRGITSGVANNYTVTVDGITQIPNTNYSINLANKTITFVEAPPVNTNILIVTR